MNENITRNEILNDGKTIHLYFNGMIGLYVTYGLFCYVKYQRRKRPTQLICKCQWR